MRPLRPSMCILFVAGLVLAVEPAIALEVGDPAPQFAARELTSADAPARLSLSDYRGKVVYLDFWASWCPPCLKSLPLLEELRNELDDERFQILAINVDREPQRALDFLGKHSVGYPSASDPEGRLPKTFEIETMPTSFLIDENGVVRYVHPGFRKGDMVQIKKQIEMLLGESR